MKKIYSFLILLISVLSAGAQSKEPVLMVVNGKEVTRSEFEYAFNKNRGNVSDEGETVEEYLKMYIDFKLKVAEAEYLQLDTLTSFKEEYKKDRDQLAESYLTIPNYVENEAYKIYAKDSATIGKDGFLQVSHIFFPLKQRSEAADIALAKANVAEAYEMLSNGKSFDEVVNHFGISPRMAAPFEIIRGQVYAEFENTAYALADGEFSQPIETPAGYHVVMRLSSRPFGSFEEYRPAIIKMLEQQDIRESARIKRGYELAEEFGGNMTPQEALAREDSLLETKYPEFGNLMREYHDGLLFFEVSTREVWDKAAKDEEGLVKFFNKNKKKYVFDSPRYRGAVLHANSQENLEMLKSMLVDKKHAEYKSVIEAELPKDSVNSVRVEIGVFAQGDNAWVDKSVFGVGEGGKHRRGFNYVDVVGEVIAAPQVYTDVKGSVTADYQKYLEEKWLQKLRKKYKVKVNKEVLKTVNNHD
ncbi:MAG: peptidylprolyl isomerase [Bacteroidaceae bacterium]|nr:peptidylprolyl isomerase [Bacteroidaceae bacterium]